MPPSLDISHHSVAMRVAAYDDLNAGGPWLHVEVREGVAVLTGTADTWQDYMRAEADAYAAGVSVVDNRLRVRFG